MPVDRSLLPPLPGKPDWYVEDAPFAVDLSPRAPQDMPTGPAMPVQQVERPAPSYLPQTSPLQAPAFPTHGGKGLSRIKALLHK